LVDATFFGMVTLRPELRTQLPVAAKCLKAFTKAVPTTQRPPISWSLAVAMAMWLARDRGLDYGVALLLGHDCLLRVSELCKLRRQDIVWPGDIRVGNEYKGTVIRLPKTKTGLNQSVVIQREGVITSLRMVAGGRINKDGPLWNFSQRSFTEAFRCARDALHLPSSFTCHSLRHGGATAMFLNSAPMADIAERGRWRSAKSCSRYIQSARGLMVEVTVQNVARRLAMEALALPSLDCAFRVAARM